MTVENTNPIQHFTANGQSTVFAIGFAVEDKNSLKVTVNGTTVSVNDYSYDALANAVVFNTAPVEGIEVVIERVTSLERSINYQTYNNSFRPETLNYDLDRIWHVLQEDKITDAEILARIKDEIEWRRTHNTEWDLLAQTREQGLFNALKSYMDAIGAMSVPNLFDGITDNVVITEDGVSQRVTNRDLKKAQAELKEALNQFSSSAKAYTDVETIRAVAEEEHLASLIDTEKTRATAIEQALQVQVNTLGVGNSAYLTYAAMVADKANIPSKSKVTVTNDSTASNNGDWQYDGTTFTKSSYDPLAQAKAYADANAQFAPYKIGNFSLNTLTKVGIYFATDTVNATTANNYPEPGVTGIVHVAQASNSSLIFQEFRSAQGIDYWRSWNGTTWSEWKLKIDFSKFETVSKSFTDLGVLIEGMNLNDLTATGRYSLSSGSNIATLELNYPENGVSGVLEVIRNTGSSVVLQRFTVWGTTTKQYTRMFRNSWSAWISGQNINAIQDKGVLDTAINLNDIKESGFYIKNSTPSEDFSTLNYPVRTAGMLVVYKSQASSLIYQRYTTANFIEYIRSWNGTSWTAWTVLTVNPINSAKIISTFTTAMNADDLKTEFGYYMVNSQTLDLATTNLPIKSLGVLKVYKGTMTSFVLQEFITNTGITYTRHWNNVVWSAWSIPTTGSSSGASADTFDYSKTANSLTWYLPSTVGSKYILHRFIQQIDSTRNLNSWGMGMATEVSSNKATSGKNLTTTGVWECAIVDSENVGDHSGGGHGDEVQSLSYFLIDGIYKDSSFVGSGRAKEIKHVQHSTIYVEAQNTPICIRKTTWSFTKERSNCKTQLIFPSVRTLRAARIAMLPIYRKANQDGTGEQITDKEIRSQDNLVIDVTEHGFAKRDLPVKDGDSILLSSDTSKISAEVIINKIKADDPHAFVQNTVLYNKVYIDGSVDGVNYTTTTGEEWLVDADFKIRTQN